MTTIKIEGKPSAAAANALGRHAEALYHTDGARRLGVVEIARTGRYVPDSGEDKDPSVSLRIAALEIASPEQEDHLRQAMLALHLHRTAAGHVSGVDGLVLDPNTLELTGAMLHASEAARLRVGVTHWADLARRALSVQAMTLSEARHELDAIATGLEALILLATEQPT